MRGHVGLHAHRLQRAALHGAAVEYDPGQPCRVWPQVDLLPRSVAAELTEAFSDTVRVPLTSGYCQDVALRFWPVGGAPATLTAVSPVLHEAGI